jgi:hypothetical protein
MQLDIDLRAAESRQADDRGRVYLGKAFENAEVQVLVCDSESGPILVVERDEPEL